MSSELLNAKTTTVEITTYDRTTSAAVDNPYDGVPSLTFQLQRVTVSDDKILSSEYLPSVTEMYDAKKVYAMFDPTTGAPIPGMSFSASQTYAMLYSIMRRALADRSA